MRERDRARIEGSLCQVDAWRASSMKVRDYCQADGQSFEQWRAWRGGVEQTWRAALGDIVPRTPGFAQVVVGESLNLT